MSRTRIVPVLALLVAAFAACAHPAGSVGGPTAGRPGRYDAVVAAPDRLEDDRVLDAGRKPVAMLGFIGVGPGAKVADLAAGEGYTTELLARTVGPAGVVYAQNPPSLLEKFPGVAIALAARLARPSCKNVVRVDRELDAPLPPEAHDLDAVVMNLFYHDTYWLGTDRRKMNAAILAALRPGGVFVVIDHSAKPGAGSTVVSSLHRVDEKLVRDEITAAGFALGSESSFLRNPSDTRDWIVFDEKRRGTTDRFALKFVQPR